MNETKMPMTIYGSVVVAIAIENVIAIVDGSAAENPRYTQKVVKNH